MNGSNSNTSGAAVANIGFLPRTLLQRVISILQAEVGALNAIVAGDATPAQVDFAAATDNDKVADEVMEEIVRRLIVTIETAAQGNILFQPTAPDDHTKLWWQTDPLTNFPTGRLKQWDEDEQAWVNVDTTGEYTPPERRTGIIFAPAGNSTINLPFADIKTSSYEVRLSPTTFNGSTWAVAPVTFPSTFGWVVVNQTSTLVSVAFYGIPTGGLWWRVVIEELPEE